MLKLYKLCTDPDAFLTWNNFVFTHSVIAVKKLASGTKKYITIPFFLFLLIKNVCIVSDVWMAYNDIESWGAEKQSTYKMTADEESVWINFFSSLPIYEYHKTVFPFFVNVGQNKRAKTNVSRQTVDG